MPSSLLGGLYDLSVLYGLNGDLSDDVELMLPISALSASEQRTFLNVAIKSLFVDVVFFLRTCWASSP
jgi:hypothetical protein